MPEAINPASIFLPMLALVALTFVAFVRMARARGAAIKGGHDPAYYRAHLGAAEPEATVAAVRHWDNLFELPTLFYAACLTAFVLNAVTAWTLGLAWAWVAARLAQSAVHMTSNNPMHRAAGFMLGVLVLFALWVVLAMAVFARL